jgi:nitrous oxidase accessory protein NosD
MSAIFILKRRRELIMNLKVVSGMVVILYFSAQLIAVSAAETISVPSVGITTINQAMIMAKNNDTIMVSDGLYKERVFLKSGVALIARNQFKAVIDGGGKGIVVSLGTRSTIRGFEIRNGTIGVFSKDADNVIVNCRIIQNWETGLMCVRHLPKIEDNIIAFNRASGIVGWHLRSTSASINHNTIAFNQNHGIDLGGVCEVIIENNMITFNERLGIKLSHGSQKSQLNKNNIYGNLNISSKVPAENFAFDPKFTSPKMHMNFTVESKLPCCAYGSDNQILGTRIEN